MLAGLVPCPVRPILFLELAKRIVDGNAVVAIISRRKMSVVRRSGHSDTLVARVLEDSAGQVAGVRPLKHNL